MKRLKGLSFLIPAILISASSYAQLSILPDIPLEEYNLGGRTLTVNTLGDTLNFSITPADFLLLNGPPGLFIADVFRVNNDIVDIILGWNYMDFDANFTNFMIQFQPSALITGGSPSTNPLTITAYVENPSATLTPDIPLEETILDGRQLMISLTDEWFIDYGSLLATDFTLLGGPPGMTIDYIQNVADSSYVDVFIAFDATDFDVDYPSFHIQIGPGVLAQSPGGMLTGTEYITALIEPIPTATISADSVLTEQRLDFRTIYVNLLDEMFFNYGQLSPLNFTLIDAPPGTTIENAYGMTPFTADILLAFDGTDFDVNYNSFQIDIAAVVLNTTSAGVLSSNSLSISAYIEAEPPVIQFVGMPDSPLRIGDLGSVLINVDDDLGNVFTLNSGTIGGYILENLIRASSTTYQAEFWVTEGGTDFAAGNDIPVTNLQLMNAALPSIPFNGVISQANDPIDANRPLISSASIISVDNFVTVGEDIIISISAIENGLILDNVSIVNSIPLTAPNITFDEIGGGSYTVTYTVQLGDPNVLPGNLAVNFVMIDALGNTSIPPYTTLSVNTVEINTTPYAVISADSVLEETRLDSRYISLALKNESFTDTAILSLAHFSLANGPAGLSFERLIKFDMDSVRLDLQFDGTDFDLVTDIVISIDHVQLVQTSGSNLESNPLPVNAIVELEPTVTSVTIPDTPVKIGDNIPLTINVLDDQGNTYTLASGTLGLYPIINLVRLNNTTYTATIQITEGGTMYPAAADIPASNLQLMNGALPGIIYNDVISQANDEIDPLRPVISQASITSPSSYAEAGETVEILLVADSIAYSLDNNSTVNGSSAGNPNISMIDNGNNTYTINYTVAFGDPDVDSSTLQISIVLIDAAGNISAAFTSIDANSLTIFASQAILDIQEDSALVENRLHDRYLIGWLRNEAFIDHSLLVKGNFSLVNAPTGLSIDSIMNTSADSLILQLAFDGTDFTNPYTQLKLSIDHTVLSNSTANLISVNSLFINPEDLALSYSKTDVSKTGGVDGSINLRVRGGAPPYTYKWSNGAFMEDLTMLAAGTYTVTVTDSKGIKKSETIEILDLIVPCTFTVNFTHIVAGNTVTFSNLSDASNYNWQFGDGSVSEIQSPSHTYSYPGLYEVCLLGINSAGDCIKKKCIKIEVGIIDCSAEFGFILDTATANMVHFINATTGAADGWYWNFGDGKTSTKKDPSHTFPESGYYMVCLNTIDQSTGCQSRFCLEINVGAMELKADFTYFVDPTARKVNFSDHSTGDITAWYWTFGDGNFYQGKDTVHQYDKPGKYAACLIVWDKVADTRDEICHEIQVGTPQCNVNADFSYFIDESKQLLSMTDHSTGNASSWFWDFGDGFTSSRRNPTHVYADSGIYLVSVSVRDKVGDCFDFHSEWVQLGGVDCKSGFVYTVDPASRTVHFKDRSRGNIAEYFWYFDDGAYASSGDFSHTYKKAGRYMVSLTVVDQSGLCMDYYQEEVQVGSVECNANFTYYVDSASNQVYFTSNIIGTATDLMWIFGDGYMTKKANPIYQFPAPGYYSVGLNTYNSLNGCMDYYKEIILIGSQGYDCKAGFIYETDMISKKVSFTSKSLGAIESYLWDFGDGETSENKNPVHTYIFSGNYWICLTVFNTAGFSDTYCKQIQVAPTTSENCLADFIYSVDSVNQTVIFRDKSFGEPNSWTWNFDDGTISNEENPEHIYADSGYYTVRLDIRNSSTACTHSALQLINVSQGNQGLVADFVFIDNNPKLLTRKAESYPVDFIGISLGDGSKLKWTFGDGDSSSTSLVTTHEYKELSIFEACFEVSNPVTGDAFEECQFIDLTGGTVPYIFGNGIVLANHPNPFDLATTITYQIPGSAEINLSVYNVSGTKVKELVNAYIEAGIHSIDFKRNGFANGIYIIKLNTPDGYRTSKMIIR